mgnify:CR=1 FL=1
MLSKSPFTATATQRALMLACAWMMTACASSAPPSAPPLPPASLRQPCPALSPPADGLRATMLRWSIQTARDYRECASRHQRLVDAIERPGDEPQP